MRVFIGIDLPDEIKQTLLKFQEELKILGVSGSWKLEDNFHITLEFFGELETNAIAVITKVLDKEARNSKPFNLTLEGIGGFPSLNRPHTLWTGVGGCLSELHQLRDNIHTELAQNGFILENRQFKPHLTLASRPRIEGVDLSVFKGRILGEFLVEEVVLFESKAVRGKRIYTGLSKSKLK